VLSEPWSFEHPASPASAMDSTTTAIPVRFMSFPCLMV
jgi:hypothetical protein